MGSQIIREYETLFALNPELTDDKANELLDRLRGVIVKMGGEILREDPWGKRKFSFEVKKHLRGNFMNFHYVAVPGTVEELERTMRNVEGVIRYLSTVHGDVGDIEAKKAEIEKSVREAEAAQAKREAERLERAESATPV